MHEALYRCYWSEFESWSHEEGMEFRTETLNIALNKLNSAFCIGKLGIELRNIDYKLQEITEL